MLSEIMGGMTMIWHENTDFINFKNKTCLSFPQESLFFPLLCLPVSLHLTFLMFVCICITCFHILSLSSIQSISLNPHDLKFKHTMICLCLCESAERCATCRSAKQGSASLQRMLGALPVEKKVCWHLLSCSDASPLYMLQRNIKPHTVPQQNANSFKVCINKPEIIHF